MKTKRYRPLVDWLTWVIWIPTLLIIAAGTVVACFEPASLLVMIPTDLFTLYFFVSPLVGYAELRDEGMFVKFGFILKREIPYSKIRGVELVRRWYSESMLSLKCSMEHINIRYGSFDLISVSVKENAELLAELCRRADIRGSQ